MAKSRHESDRPPDPTERHDTPGNGVDLEAQAESVLRRRRTGKSDTSAVKDKVKSAPNAFSDAASDPSVRANSIRPSRTPERPERPASGPVPGTASDKESGSERRAGDSEQAASGAPSGAPTARGNDANSAAIPQAVRDRFIQDGRRYYFPDGALAFKDFGQRLTTPSENTEVVHSLIEIAEARGWNEITVRGTERFRQEAWRQARLAGLQVRGYKPTGVEQAQLVRALAGRAQGAQTNPHGGSELDSVSETLGAPVAEPTLNGARGGSASPKASRERIVGKLLDHGRDTYRHDPHEEPSYFVRVETKTGKREIWGQDLERAMSKALTQPQIGEEVTLQRAGREPVTVKRYERDTDGQVVASQEVKTFRNRWIIERSDFFEQRAAAAGVLRDSSVAPQQAVRQHPELAGTYLNLKAAEIAARTMRDLEDQKRFVALVRSAMADQIERGEPLQPVRLRERESRSVPRDRDSIQARS